MPKWLKVGCLGCLGVIVVLFAVGAAMTGIAMLRVRSEKVAEDVRRPALPEATPVPSPSPEAAPEGGAAPGPPTATPGRVVLELRHAAFRILPAPAGDTAHVDARYDTRSYRLDENVETAPDGSWTWRVRFERTESGLMSMLRQIVGGGQPEVTVYLPEDARVDLDARIRQGATEAELGGLWLGDVTFDVQQGGFDLSFGDPTRQPLHSLTLLASMGGVNARHLGNASPERLRVDMSMGGMSLDLRGRWTTDSTIDIDHRMGGLDVRLPADVELKGLEGFAPGVAAPENPEVPRPTLTFSSKSSMGEIQFRR